MSSPVITTPAASHGAGSDEAAEVADRIEEIAAEPGLADRSPHLNALASALRDQDLASQWQRVPLHAALGNPITLPEAPGAGLVKWFDTARTALVFLPVGVTWFGVYRAGSLYRAELATSPDLGAQSFFRLWLSGFNGQMWLTFHRMAFIIALVILAIVVLTVLIEARRSSDQALHEQQERELAARLNGLLTEASIQLARTGSPTPEQFGQELTRVAGEMGELVTAVRSAAEAASDAMRAASGAGQALESSATSVENAATSLQQDVNHAAAAVATVTDAVRQLETTVGQLLTDAVSRGDAAAAGLASAVGDAAGQLSAPLQAIHEAIDRFGATQDNHRDKLGIRLGEHEEAVRALLPDLADRIAQTQTSVLDGRLIELRDAIENLARAHDAVVRALRRPAVKSQASTGSAGAPQPAKSQPSTGSANAPQRSSGWFRRWFQP